LIGLFRGSDVLHGPTHTYAAALVIAAIVAAIAPWVCRPILQRWHQELSFHGLPWLIESESFAPAAVIAGALIGTLSHVMLDSIMHSDISPLAPWSNVNVLLGLVSIETLHLFCVGTGLLGVGLWLSFAWRKRAE
jgi:membrane-bound metal-dependent hydrolase YbcI (DUF457 family)